jgi:hypothetical protein
MYNEEQEIDNTMAQWMTSKRFSPDATTNAAIRQRVEENLEKLGGYPSIASFERAYLELLNEDAIQPFRGSIAEQPAAAPAIPPDVIAWIENPRVSSFEQRRRYSTDKEFKRYYDLYADQQLKARIAQETGGFSLSAEEYRSLPAATVVQRYRRDRGFKIAVDKLIAEGKI